MNPLIRSGLISGAIGGEVMVLIVLINAIILRNFSGADPGDSQSALILIWSVAYPLLVILIFEAGGIFSSWLCHGHARNMFEAVLPGVIAGIMIGIILEIMWIANILSLAARTAFSLSAMTSGYDNTLVIIALLIILIVMGGTLSGFGSYIFSMRSIHGRE